MRLITVTNGTDTVQVEQSILQTIPYFHNLQENQDIVQIPTTVDVLGLEKLASVIRINIMNLSQLYDTYPSLQQLF